LPIILEKLNKFILKKPKKKKVQFLLVKFNHTYEKLRKLADILLAKLMERYFKKIPKIKNNNVYKFY
jgi:hypothetical protein